MRTFLTWQPPALYGNHRIDHPEHMCAPSLYGNHPPHMATIGSTIRSTCAHLPYMATAWQPPALYDNHLPHMATTCLIWQPPASYGNHPPHMASSTACRRIGATFLIWQVPPRGAAEATFPAIRAAYLGRRDRRDEHLVRRDTPPRYVAEMARCAPATFLIWQPS